MFSTCNSTSRELESTHLVITPAGTCSSGKCSRYLLNVNNWKQGRVIISKVVELLSEIWLKLGSFVVYN